LREHGPLLHEYLSYDEMAVAALLGLSSPTQCINDGGRGNRGLWRRGAEQRAVYIGQVGCRFEKSDRMDWRHMVFINKDERNGNDKGYAADPCVGVFEKLYLGNDDDLNRLEDENPPTHFRQNVYAQRCELLAETLLFEANRRGAEAGQDVCAVTVGLGLGVWAGNLKNIPASQKDAEEDTGRMANVDCLKEIYMKAFLKCLAIHSQSGALNNIKAFEFNFGFNEMFSNHPEMLDLLKKHGATITQPRMKHSQDYLKINGIEVFFTVKNCRRNGNPFAPSPVSQGKLIVANYAWDSNSYPGNEIHWGMLSASGDPAAWCCSTMGRAGNPEINKEYVSGDHAVVLDGKDSPALKADSASGDPEAWRCSTMGRGAGNPEFNKERSCIVLDDQVQNGQQTGPQKEDKPQEGWGSYLRYWLTKPFTMCMRKSPRD